MTPPVTTDALVEARDLVRQSIKGGAPGLTEATREAVVGSIMLKLTNKVLAPLLAALQQVTAERDAAREQAGLTWTAPDIDAWGRHAEEKGLTGIRDRLNRLFRRAIRAEGEIAAADQRVEAAEAAYRLLEKRADALRAEGEAKDRRIARLEEALAPFADAAALFGPPAAGREYTVVDAQHLRAARAATAREG